MGRVTCVVGETLETDLCRWDLFVVRCLSDCCCETLVQSSSVFDCGVRVLGVCRVRNGASNWDCDKFTTGVCLTKMM